MSEKNIMQTLIKNSTKNKKHHEPDQHLVADPSASAPIHYEEAQVQSDLAPVDSELEALKRPHGL
jgi:hypothetical protein